MTQSMLLRAIAADRTLREHFEPLQPGERAQVPIVLQGLARFVQEADPLRDIRPELQYTALIALELDQLARAFPFASPVAIALELDAQLTPYDEAPYQADFRGGIIFGWLRSRLGRGESN